MNHVQSVIFDMDGVIVDSHPAHRRAWREFLQSLGAEIADEELEFILEGRKRSEILQHFLGEMPESKLAEYGRIKDEFFGRIALEVKPVPGVIEFVRSLACRRIKLGIATSASASRTLSTLRRLELSDRFATVVTGDDVPEGKSNPTIYELVCSRLHAKARCSWVFEDAASAIRTAKQAGFMCIGVNSGRGTSLQAAGADYVIDDFVGFSFDDLQNRTGPSA
jgi:beta-phosphoglucomutase